MAVFGPFLANFGVFWGVFCHFCTFQTQNLSKNYLQKSKIEVNFFEIPKNIGYCTDQLFVYPEYRRNRTSRKAGDYKGDAYRASAENVKQKSLYKILFLSFSFTHNVHGPFYRKRLYLDGKIFVL